MSHQVQELIDKIKSEGVQAADHQAAEIKAKAKAQADQIVADAKAQAAKLIADAEKSIASKEQAAQTSIGQAGRDTLLSLRKQIERILNAVIQENVGEALSADQLSKILNDVVTKSFDSNQNIQVSVNSADEAKLKKSFVANLQDKIKKGFKLQSSDDVSKGFMISFDGGKSNFDFTDKALSEYLSSFVNSEIAGIIKGSAN